MKSLYKQFSAALGKKTKYGQSKMDDRKRAQMKNTASIYSYKTFQAYLAACKRFCAWLAAVYPDVMTMDEAVDYVPDYLWQCREDGLSAWTVSLYASALAKAYGCQSTDWGVSVERRREDIKRSRLPAARDYGFSEANNRDFVTFCRGTGVRREDLEYNVAAGNFAHRDGFYWMRVLAGKGGRARWAIVLPDLSKEVERIVDEAEDARGPQGRLFARVPTHADIHGYRRDYAQRLYAYCAENPLFCAHLQDILQAYPKAKSEEYYGRGIAHGAVWNRQALAVVSACLGHGPDRAETVVNHYLR